MSARDTEGRVVDPLVAPVAGVVELAAAGHRLEMAREVDDVAVIAAESALEILGASSAALCRIAQDTCRTIAAAPPSRDVREVLFTQGSLRAEQRPALRALISDRASWRADVTDPLSDAVEVGTLRDVGGTSALGVPVVVNGAVWGQVTATRRAEGRPFGERDVAAAEVLAGLVAGAIARVDLEGQVRHLVADDPLTGLGNRRIADSAADHALASGQETCIVMCDVDGLKRVNDELGHDVGDDLLRSVGDVLRRITEELPGSTAGRIGGDEFCVVTMGHHRADVQEVVSRIVAEFPLPHGAAISYGLASTAVTGAVPARTLFRRADAAQYRAKRARARLRQLSLPPQADPAVTAERMLVYGTAALGRASAGVVARLCAVAAGAADVLGGGEWSVLGRLDGGEPAVVARGGSPADLGSDAVLVEGAYGTWSVGVGASSTAATGDAVTTALQALVAVAVLGAA
ncbi:diguanylate cyclase [Cellulomonas sp. 73-92]|uniref:GGDEF domain-containing protein n=1 Tax=Cellulomonas sp. 73-92 TaxID=1895740 RepID=UPI0025BBB530|nr:diguanylate cyclase [Cellulomonas sp. 73-92]